MGICAWFGALSGDCGYRETEGQVRERKRVDMSGGEPGWRVESYNVCIPTEV